MIKEETKHREKNPIQPKPNYINQIIEKKKDLEIPCLAKACFRELLVDWMNDELAI